MMGLVVDSINALIPMVLAVPLVACPEAVANSHRR